MAPALSADTYSATDCGQPGSDLYAQCQALFPDIPTPPLPDLSTLGEIPGQSDDPSSANPHTYTVAAISDDGQYVAVSIRDADIDQFVHVWHNGVYSDSLMYTFGLWPGILKINDRGEVLGLGPCEHLGFGIGDSYVTSIGCFETDVPDHAAAASGIDGGVG